MQLALSQTLHLVGGTVKRVWLADWQSLNLLRYAIEVLHFFGADGTPGWKFDPA